MDCARFPARCAGSLESSDTRKRRISPTSASTRFSTAARSQPASSRPTATRLRAVREMGHVNDIFTADRLKDLPGFAAIGHVRYSTAGDSSKKNAQPIAVDYVGRLGRGRPQRQPGQRGRAARAAGGGGRDLPDHLRHRVHRSPHRPLARADAARARGRRASPGARRLLAGVPDRELAGRGARSDGLPAARAGQVQGQGQGRSGSCRRRPARSSCSRPSSCATSSRARW